MRVSLRQPIPNLLAPAGASPLLSSAGPRAILGTAPGPGADAAPLEATDRSLFGPRGAVLGRSANGGRALAVCDTGHHRLMIWQHAPGADQAPADLLIGQSDFAVEGRNGKGDVGVATLNVPTGVALGAGVLAVADAWNHRVLLWHGLPERSNQPADVVIGQRDFTRGQPNRGASEAAADTLNWCYGVAVLDGNLVVADTGNRRVLLWQGIPEENGRPADLVIGQADFTTRDENAGAGAGPLGMRWPHAVALCGERLLIADAGNSRVLIWDRVPRAPGVAADGVLGQADFVSSEHNRGHYLPAAGTLNMPYGLAADDRAILVSDTANSRLLGWRSAAIYGPEPARGGDAQGLASQPHFSAKGDNRWGPPARDSLCWPYAVGLTGDTAVISDSGNNRVLLWDLDPAFVTRCRGSAGAGGTG